MSEQWWAVKYIGSKYSFQTVFGEISTNKKECQEIIESLPEKEHVNFVIVPVRIVEDAAKCEYCQHFVNNKHCFSFRWEFEKERLEKFYYKFCPMCGRSLEDK